MSDSTIALLLVAFLFGSGLTIQIFVLPRLAARVTDRSAVTRVSHEVLKGHHTLAIFLLPAAAVFLFLAHQTVAAVLIVLLLGLNLYQRLWIFTKIHVVKQPIGVQDLIQPDNTLREEFNRLQFQLFLL
ncbi:MAG TPA: hypothetical protein VI958_07710, partial [Acidobacteriota bacterium]